MANVYKHGIGRLAYKLQDGGTIPGDTLSSILDEQLANKFVGAEPDVVVERTPKTGDVDALFRKYVPPHLREAFGRAPATRFIPPEMRRRGRDLRDALTVENTVDAGLAAAEFTDYGDLKLMQGGVDKMFGTPGWGTVEGVGDAISGGLGLMFPIAAAGIKNVGGKAVDTVVDALPKDTTSRMKRAEEMGLTDDFYHGTNRTDIEELQAGDLGVHVGSYEQANNRIIDKAKQRGEIPEYGGGDKALVEGANVIPLKVNRGKQLEMPDVGMWNDSDRVLGAMNDIPEYRTRFNDAWEELGVKDQYEDYQDWLDSSENKEMLDEIRQTLMDDGYGSIKYHNAVENQYGLMAGLTPAAKAERDAIHVRRQEIIKAASDRRGSPELGASREDLQKWIDTPVTNTPAELAELERLADRSMELSDHTLDPYSHIILDPKNTRSPHAMFDPTKKDSANLLASVGGASLLGVGGSRMFRDDE